MQKPQSNLNRKNSYEQAISTFEKSQSKNINSNVDDNYECMNPYMEMFPKFPNTQGYGMVLLYLSLFFFLNISI